MCVFGTWIGFALCDGLSVTKDGLDKLRVILSILRIMI